MQFETNGSGTSAGESARTAACSVCRIVQPRFPRFRARDCPRIVQRVRQTALEQLDAVEAQLNAEEREDEAARTHYGREWPLQEASSVTANLRDRLAGYRSLFNCLSVRSTGVILSS